MRLGEAGAEARPLVFLKRTKIGGIDPVRDDGDALLFDRVDVGNVVAHVGGAGDDLVCPVRHPVLDAVNVTLGMLVHPTLMASVLGWRGSLSRAVRGNALRGDHRRQRRASRGRERTSNSS